MKPILARRLLPCLLLTLALALCLVPAAALAQNGAQNGAQPDAPVEFRGLPFGVSLEGARNMVGELEPVAPLAPGGEQGKFKDVYYRPDEEMRFGQAEILSVGYVFRDDHLREVMITLSGETNVFLVKERLIETYGPGRQVGPRYGWTWPNFSLVLASDPEGGLSSLVYTLER